MVFTSAVFCGLAGDNSRFRIAGHAQDTVMNLR